MKHLVLCLVALLGLGGVASACDYQPVFQQQVGCYSAQAVYAQPVVRLQQSYYAQPVVQRVVVQKQVAYPVVQRVKVQQFNAYQSFSARPQVIQQSTVQRKGIFGLKKVRTNTTIINP